MELHTHKLLTPIITLNFKERSLLFAELAQIAYLDEKNATKVAKQLGFTTVEFYNIDGAQTYRFMNKNDIVIACRGTEPTEFNDIKADLKAFPVRAETISRVHRGFKTEVDELWPLVKEDIVRKQNEDKDLWFCGHSLGAAMATIMASRCKHNLDNLDPRELYTYGSPRVGWRKYCDSLDVVHHRWVNNNDIVTTVPLAIMGYKHHGTQHYLNSWGNVRTPSGWQLIKDKLRGMWRGIKQGKVDNFSDHGMALYVQYLKNYRDNMETPQI
jgi:triacylglycerol lipase